jgi:hypothetical protein
MRSASQERPGESPAEPPEHDVVDRAEAERSDLHAPDGGPAQRMPEAERKRLTAGGPPGEKNSDRICSDTSKRELE